MTQVLFAFFVDYTLKLFCLDHHGFFVGLGTHFDREYEQAFHIICVILELLLKFSKCYLDRLLCISGSMFAFLCKFYEAFVLFSWPEYYRHLLIDAVPLDDGLVDQIDT